MNKQNKLFAADMRPVVCCPARGEPWRRVAGRPCFGVLPTREGLGGPGGGGAAAGAGGAKKSYRLQFRHTFDGAEEHFFAFCYPHNAQDCRDFLDRLEQSAARLSDKFEFRRETLATSRQGRPLEVLTITSRDGGRRGGAAAAGGGSPSTTAEEVPRGKSVFFLSARVHPGETPASFILNGVLNFLVRSSDRRAQVARQRFVLKVVPMINPDGVDLGHYRQNSLGQNLNRHYEAPSQEEQPEILAIKELVLGYARQGRLGFYVDLHAHANKKGIFLFGNALPPEAQVETILYSKLLTLNCPHFDLSNCNFTEKNMCSTDKEGSTKEGSGRVALFKATGLTHIYTVETNYSTSRIRNIVPEADLGREAVGSTAGRPVSPMSKARAPVPFDIPAFEGMGRALVVSALDFEGVNPWSRVPNSPFRTFQALRTWANSFLNSSDPVLSTRSRRQGGSGAGGEGTGVGRFRALPRSSFSFTPLPTGSPIVPSPAE